MSPTNSTLEQLKKRRAAGMPDSSPSCECEKAQLDATEDELSRLLTEQHEHDAHAALDSCNARRRLKALRGTADISKVPRR